MIGSATGGGFLWDRWGNFIEGFAAAILLAIEPFEPIGLAGLFAGADAVATEDVARFGG
jgi:hypothetical protein